MSAIFFKVIAQSLGKSKKELLNIPPRDFVNVYTKDFGGPFKVSFVELKGGVVTLIFIGHQKTGELMNGFTGVRSDIVHHEVLTTYGLTWYVEK